MQEKPFECQPQDQFSNVKFKTKFISDLYLQSICMYNQQQAILVHIHTETQKKKRLLNSRTSPAENRRERKEKWRNGEKQVHESMFWVSMTRD